MNTATFQEAFLDKVGLVVLMAAAALTAIVQVALM
jgi:hypothetical protein